jgi:hypothetical protein
MCIVRGRKEEINILYRLKSTIVSVPGSVPSSALAPTPFPQASMCPPPPHLDSVGDTLAYGGGVGEANSDDRPGDSVYSVVCVKRMSFSIYRLVDLEQQQTEKIET